MGKANIWPAGITLQPVQGGHLGARINSEILPKVQAVRPLLRLVICRILNGLFLPISSGQNGRSLGLDSGQE